MSAPMCLVPSSKIVELANKITQKYPEACQRDGFNAEKCAEWVGKYNSINGKNPDYLPSLSKLVNAVEQWRNKDGKSFLSIPVSVTYTHSGKQQTYSIIGDRIFNKKGEEVFSKDRRSSKKHRERIFSILRGDSTNRNNTNQNIDSDSITAQLIEHLRPMWQAMGLQIYDKAGIEALLKNNPNAINTIQQAAERKEMADIKAKAIADGTFMKAPNGKPTNLTERQWLQVRTQAFKKWFGDWENDSANASKVVDENGEPLVVYHNSQTKNITVFKPGVGNAIFFADAIAQKYVEGFERGDYNYAVFLNIKNPHTESYEASFIDEDTGVDGIFVSAEVEEGVGHAAIVKNPNQIKSAVNNNGDFSTENDDIQAFTEQSAIESNKNSLYSIETTSLNITGNTFKRSLYRGQPYMPEIDAEGNLHLRTNYDSLSRLYTLSFDNSLDSAESYGYRESHHPFIIEVDADYLDTVTPREEYSKEKIDSGEPFSYDEFGGEVRLSFKGELIIPKGKFNITQSNEVLHYSTFDDILVLIRDLQYREERAEIAEYNGYSQITGRESQLDLENYGNAVEQALKGLKYKGYPVSDILYSMLALNNSVGGSPIGPTANYREYIEKGILEKEEDGYFEHYSPSKDFQKFVEKELGLQESKPKPANNQTSVSFNPVATSKQSKYDYYNDDYDLPFFTTKEGEVYGFLDKNGNMYLDETIIKPEHPIHEYTHMWDRVVAERNPELWKQGVSLMQQVSLWDEISNSENYGKKWVSMGIKGDKLNDLIASEVHSRLTGREGERILNEIAAKKGNEGIIAKLRQWLTDFFRELKATFSNWTREEISHLTLEDFVNMTIRDLAYGTPFDTMEDVSEMPEEMLNDFAENDALYRQQEELRKQMDARPSSDSQLDAKFGNKDEVTVSEILDNLLSFNTPYEGFVKALKDNLGELGSLKIKLVNASHEMIGRGSAGIYDPSSNTIYINRNSAYKGKGGIVDGTILHEIVHAIVSNSLKTKERKSELEALFNEAREKILKKYGVDDYKDLPPYLKTRLYGLSNLNEFAAEFFTSSGLISELNDENTFGERSNKKSLFHRLIEWIKSLLPKGITDIYKNSAEVLEDIILNSGGQIQEDRILLDESRDNPLADMQNSNDLSSYEFYSGGADGSDKLWAAIARRLGIKVTEYTRRDWDAFSVDEKAKLDREYREVANALARPIIAYGKGGDVEVRRDMKQANDADAIFAIGQIVKPGQKGRIFENKSDHECVDGGTGYAVQRGIIRGIPVYVYDQTAKQWKMWDKNSNSFVPTAEPTLTPHAATIGTRDINDNGRMAIRNILSNSVNKLRRNQNTINQGNGSSNNKQAGSSNQKVSEQFKKDIDSLAGYFEGGGATIYDVLPNLSDELNSILSSHFMEFMGKKKLTDEDYQKLWNAIEFYSEGEYRVPRERKPSPVSSPSPAVDVNPSTDILRRGAVDDDSEPAGPQGQSGPTANNNPQPQKPRAEKPKSPAFDSALNVKKDRKVEFYQTFTPQQIIDRGRLISDFFSDIIDENIQDIKDDLKEAAEDQSLSKSKRTEAKKKLNEFRDPIKGRQLVAQHLGIPIIINKIREQIEMDRDRTSDENKKILYQNTLDYFEELFNTQASLDIEAREGIRIVGLKIDDSNTAEDEADEADDGNDETGHTATGSDGWGFQVRYTNPFDSLSRAVRGMMYSIEKAGDGKNGTEEDDLGHTRYYPMGQIYATFLSYLAKHMENADDFMVIYKDRKSLTASKYVQGRKYLRGYGGEVPQSIGQEKELFEFYPEGFPVFPILEEMARVYPWVSQIIDRLTNDFFNREDNTDSRFPSTYGSLASQFYTNFRKAYIPYGKIQLGGFGVIPLNYDMADRVMYDKLVANYNNRMVLTEWSIYDGNGKVNRENATKLKDKCNTNVFFQNLPHWFENLDSLSKDEMNKYNSALGHAQKVIQSFGIDISQEGVVAYLAMGKFGDLMDKLGNIAEIIEKLDDKDVESFDYIIDTKNRHGQNQWTHFFDGMGLITDDTYMQSFYDSASKKTKYSYSADNYLMKIFRGVQKGTLEERRAFIDSHFGKYEWFKNQKTGEWRNKWLEFWYNYDELESQEFTPYKNIDNITDNSGPKKVVRPYVKWKESDIYEIQHRSYDPEKHDRSTCYYLAPIFSDSPMSMTVRGPKFSMNELLYGYKVEKKGKEGDNVNPGAISHPESDKGKYKRGAFLELVHQEMQRISYVQRRAKAIEEGKVKPIVNFDTGRGEKFCFIPELNTYTFEDGSSFLQKVNDIKAQIERGEANLRDLDALEIQVIDEILTQKAMEYYGKSNLTDAEKQEFFNMTYANASIIQMTTIDLAYYKSDTDFQKRFKEVYAGGIQLNTSSRYGMKTENVILLMDDIITSPSYKTIASIIDGRDNISKKKKEEIKGIFKNINVADAQAIRSMYAFRSMLDMMGKWDERAEEALENFKNENWKEEDFDVIYQIIKPFVYTVIDRNDGEGGVIPVPQQHKNSEICALMMYSLITNDLNNSPVYQAISEFMDKTIGADGKPLIHMGQFESAGKVGNQGVINISVNPIKVVKALLSNTEDMTKEDAEIREILDKLHLNTAYTEDENGNREYLPNTEEASLLNMFGKEKYKGKNIKGTLKSQLDDLLEEDKLSQEDYNKIIKYLRPNKDEIKDMLNKAAIITKQDGTKDINPEVVHTIPCENYYQAQYTPEHHIDAEAVFGSQGRNIVVADLPEDFELTVRGKNGPHTFKGRDAVIDFYYELLNENLIEDFFGKGNKKGLKDVFKDKESLKEAVEDVVRGNPKYGKDFIDALTIDKSTNTFTLSPNSPTMFNLMQEIVTSFFKNRITKQHVDGAALIQAAGIGLDSDLRLRYGKNNKLIGIECYMPLTSKKLFEPLLKYKMVNGERVGVLDPKELRRLGLDKAVGYRIPTENKSSMAPLIIKGFTPQQNGSAIILPAEITALAGSDFDVDKMFIILASFDVYEYDRKQAMEDYAKSKFAIAGLLKGGNLSDEEWDEAEVDKETKRGFNGWFEENKDRYKYDKPRVRVARYDFSKSPKQNGRKARNNMILSMMHGILTSKAGSESLHDPQGFEDLKHAAKIKRIASDSVLRNQLFESLGGVTSGVIPSADSIREQFLELVRQKHPDLYTKMKASVGRLSDEEVTRMYIQVTAPNPNVENDAVKTLLEASLGELENFIKDYSAPESPIYPQTFIHSHERNMAGSNQIGIYALQASMCAKYQRARVELKDEQKFMLNGNMISRVDLPDGGKRLKNEGQMVGGSADNGKDPNLSDMGSTSKTAPIIGYMLRAGLSHLEAALIIGQPIMSEAGFSTKKQDVWKEALGNVYTALDHPLEVNVTTEMLLKNILNPFSITEKERRAIAGVCYRIIMQHEGQEYLTNVSRADSPNGSLANSYAKARIQRYKVDLMQAKMSQPNFPFKKIRETISNDAIDVTASENVIREQLKGQRMAFLHGMYALGINSFSSLVAPYFFGAQEWFDDKVTKPILYNLRENMSDDEKADIVNRLYNAYIIYNLSGTALFGNETESSMKAKREYYLESFPDDFRKTLQENEEVRKLLGSILKVKTVGSRNRIVLEDVGSLDKPQKQAIKNRFESLVYSKDETVRDFAKQLFIYSYFDNGLQFKHDSFSHLFPTNFVVSFPEYTAALERLEEEPAQDELNNFIQQFLLTNTDAAYTIDGLVDPKKNVKNSGDRLVFDLNDYKNRKYLINEVMSPDPKLKGINVYPYVKYNGDIYILNKEQFDLDPSNATYSRVEKYATYPKLPLYSKQMSVTEMSQEFPYTISTQKAQEEDMSTDIYDIPMEHGDEDVDPATQSMMDAMGDMNLDGFVDPSAAFDAANSTGAEDKSSQYKKEGGEELQNEFC